jgi:RNA polymerase sporulation-specific sigma factor
MPLDDEEQNRLLLEFSKNKENIEIRNEIVEHNLRLVAFIAKKFENTAFSDEDIKSIGSIGLIKAVNTFDINKKSKLATYASRCIENEILMAIRNNARHVKESYLDEPVNTDSDGNELTMTDYLYDEDYSVDKYLIENENSYLLQQALNKLTKRQAEIVKLRHCDEMTERQVANKLGISQSYVSRLDKRICEKELPKILTKLNF